MNFDFFFKIQMGICKCKNTTDLYCFTHRCHVCEHCIVDENGDHRHCYVRKYTDYVNNSVFAPPVCGFCNKLETEGDASRTVRLPCYDIVHLTCLDAAGVAATTAQAPVKCPLCGADVFPKGASRASPVMDALCTALKDSLWASPLVEAVPKVVTTAAAATTTTVPHAKSPVPKAIEVPIPPVSDATIVPPPPPSSPSSLTDIAQVQLNATKEVDVPVNVLDVGNSGSSKYEIVSTTTIT